MKITKQILAMLLALVVFFSVSAEVFAAQSNQFKTDIVAIEDNQQEETPEEPEPVELPEIKLNFKNIYYDSNAKAYRCNHFGVNDKFTLKSNAPNTTYTKFDDKYYAPNSSKNVVINNNVLSFKARGQYAIIAHAEGYKDTTYLLYADPSPTKIVYKNINASKGYRTLVGKTPKVIFYFAGSGIPTTHVVSVKSSNTKIATATYKEKIDEHDWKVRYVAINCLKVGTVTITITTASGLKSSFKLYVQKNALNGGTIGVGEKYVPKYRASKPAYNSNNKKVVATKGNSYVYGKGVGSATISCLYGGYREHIKLTVKKAPSKITLNKSSIALGKGKTYKLTSSVPKGTASFHRTFSSSNTKIATVNKTTGLVTAKKSGTCYVTVKTYNGKIAKCKVTVKGDPKKVIVTSSIKAPYSLANGYTLNSKNKNKDYIQINAKTDTGVEGQFKYVSSNTNIIKVNSKGRIYVNEKCFDWDKTWTYGTNTAYITVTAYNGVSAKVKVTVYNDEKEWNDYKWLNNSVLDQEQAYTIKKIKEKFPDAVETKISKADSELYKKYEVTYDSYGSVSTWTGEYYTMDDWSWNHGVAFFITDDFIRNLKEWRFWNDDFIDGQLKEFKKLGYTHYAVIWDYQRAVVMW